MRVHGYRPPEALPPDAKVEHFVREATATRRPRQRRLHLIPFTHSWTLASRISWGSSA